MQTLGELIKQLRTASGLSLRQMAQQAGVTHPTVSGWEKGTHLPRVPELEGVLKTLQATAQERQKALSLLRAPRAIAQVRREAEHTMPDFAEAAGRPPSDGELLRAMRDRAGKTREETAQAAGVSVATLRRWEHSETWPSPDKLHVLCYFLGAHEAEIAALTCRDGAFVIGETNVTQEQIIGRAHALRFGAWKLPQGLEELFALRWEAQIWRLSFHRPEAQQAMFALYYWRMERLTSYERYAQAQRYVQRVLTLADLMPARFTVPTGKPVGAFSIQEARSRALILGGIIASHLAAPAKRSDGLRLAANWQDAPDPSHRAWMQSVAALLMAKAGDNALALEWGRQACVEAVGCDNEYESMFRYRDLALIMAQSGHANKALDALETSSTLNAFHEDCNARYHLQKTELLLAQNQYSQAQDHLQKANDVIASGNLFYLRPQAQELSARF